MKLCRLVLSKTTIVFSLHSVSQEIFVQELFIHSSSYFTGAKKNHSCGLAHGSDVFRATGMIFPKVSFTLDEVWRHLGALSSNWKWIRWIRGSFSTKTGVINHSPRHFLRAPARSRRSPDWHCLLPRNWISWTCINVQTNMQTENHTAIIICLSKV